MIDSLQITRIFAHYQAGAFLLNYQTNEEALIKLISQNFSTHINKNSLEETEDLLVLQNANSKLGQITIEETRKGQKFLYKTSSSSGQKCLIIPGSHNMSAGAANTLLKILEEPPAGSFIFLLCDNLNNILPTIISRCQIYSAAKEPLNIATTLTWFWSKKTPYNKRSEVLHKLQARDNELWQILAQSCQNLLTKLAKKAVGNTIILSKEEEEIWQGLPYQQFLPLSLKYDKAVTIIRQSDTFDLNQMTAAILLFEELQRA